MDKKFNKLYYSPQGYWKGKAAISRLSQVSGESEKNVYEWLKLQAIWQIYLPAPKKVIRPKFENSVPNHTHQMDLLFLPHDKVGRFTYKYALTVVDLASRYKEAQPIQNKSAKTVADAIEKIYSRSPLTFPSLVQVDDGSEFKKEFSKLMKKHGALIRRGIPGNHRSQAVVESFNGYLAQRLFSHQYYKEMKTSKRNREWVQMLPGVIKALNDETFLGTGMTPSVAIQKKTVPQKQTSHPKPELVPLGTEVRYLYTHGELEGGGVRRATDPIWSVKVYQINRIFATDPPVYYLENGPQRSFVKEELQLVPKGTKPITL